MDDLWVFGYGSLMWRPGFRSVERQRARVPGFGRSFCIYSVHHRGTEARPGLVLGLDRGGTCEGMAFRVAPQDVVETIAYLREREQVNGVYREARVGVDLVEGARKRHVVALTYLVERAHPSYAGVLPLSMQARIVRGAHGNSGNNVDYVANTLAHLRELQIREWGVERLAAVAGAVVRRESPIGRMGCDKACADSYRPRVIGRSLDRGPSAARMTRLKPLDRRRFAHRKAFFD